MRANEGIRAGRQRVPGVPGGLGNGAASSIGQVDKVNGTLNAAAVCAARIREQAVSWRPIRAGLMFRHLQSSSHEAD